jgi:hypothetical protein
MYVKVKKLKLEYNGEQAPYIDVELSQSIVKAIGFNWDHYDVLTISLTGNKSLERKFVKAEWLNQEMTIGRIHFDHAQLQIFEYETNLYIKTKE